MFVGIFVISVLVILVINFLTKRWKLLKFTSKFPGPKPHFIFGNAGDFVEHKNDPAALFKQLIDFHDIYGKHFVTWGLFNVMSISIIDPKDYETILSNTKTIRKSIEYEFLKPWLGEGLLVSFGQKWATRRKIITPTFHFNILEQFVKSFDKQTNILVQKLKPHVNKGDFNIYTYTTLTALDIICETSMGAEIHAQDHPETPYVQSVKAMSRFMFERIFSLLGGYTLLFPLTPLYWKQRRHLKVVHDFTNSVIVQRREQLLMQQANVAKKVNDDKDRMNVDFMSKPEEDDFKDLYLNRSGKEKLTFLDLLLKATVDGKPLSDADIREEVDTFMFEGHDTTTSGISLTLYHLSQHADVQERVYEELKEIFGDELQEDFRVTYSHLQDMKYLEMVIKESLRLTPPVPIIGRQTTEDIFVAGVKIPAGINISMLVYAMHNYEEFYPNPRKFDPERFTAENSKDRHPYSYIPFSAGPRNCIGQKFAMLEMKMTIAKILMNFKLLPHEPTAKLTLQGDLVLKPVNGVFLKIAQRNKVL
ncbi:cytochrome P450 4d2-like [Phlebotomus argentipes]|uniref:cytochrome P450 4d2-like n=1 Tax=Phlebotomus argentipes TaxID=94469 RepID=UPI002892D450|nr:cytochrome P450 4d2-like [Phlebotomus argentipes]